jgi:formate dehydrogenase subunit gamma
MIGLIILHVYAAIWTRGTIRAMLYGTVTRAWAKQHHRGWYRKVTGDNS